MISTIASTFTIQSIDKKRLLIRTINGNNKLEWMENSDITWNSDYNGWIVSKNTNFDIVSTHLRFIEPTEDDVVVDIEPLVITTELKKNTSRKVTKKVVLPFNNMIYLKQGGGYLLKPILGDKHPDWGFKGNKGTDYYHGGWWRGGKGGWFFRGSKLNYLIENGAVCNIEEPKETKKNVKIEKNVLIKENTGIFNDMKYSEHGKGYLLTPIIGKKHPNWGIIGNKETDYYHGGWWRNELGGWFFRGSKLDFIIKNGAIYDTVLSSSDINNEVCDIDNESSEDESSEDESSEDESSEDEESGDDDEIRDILKTGETMDGVTVSYYGKGLLVNGSLYKYQKTLEWLGGIYNEKLDVYIFRKSSFALLEEYGVERTNM